MAEKPYYLILTHVSTDELEKLVNQYRKLGYIAQGGLMVSPVGRYMQAITLENGISSQEFESKVAEALNRHATPHS